MLVKVLHRINEFSLKYHVIRGMISYGTTWPTGCLLQQIINGDEYFDYGRALRFSIYGCFYVAPTLNTWLIIARNVLPKNDIRSAIIKAILEQITFTPFAIVSFHFFMSMLSGKTTDEAQEEIRYKFLPTYKASVCVWPLVQTFNYAIVPERNRIPFVSVCSLLWTIFLADMNRKDKLAITPK